MKIETTASRRLELRICWPPCQSTSKSTSSPRGDRRLDRRARGAVEVAEDLGMLEHLARLDHRLEFAPALEEIVVAPRARPAAAAGSSPRSRSAPRGRPRAGAATGSTCPLPEGEDRMMRMPRRRLGYSTFCTCSRIWSMTTFSSSPMAVSSLDLRLGAERVGLAVELLHQEVELAPRGAAARDERARRARRAPSSRSSSSVTSVRTARSASSCARRPSSAGAAAAARTASTRLRSSAPVRPARASALARAAPRSAPRPGRSAPASIAAERRALGGARRRERGEERLDVGGERAPAAPRRPRPPRPRRPRARRAPRGGRPRSSARGRARAAAAASDGRERRGDRALQRLGVEPRQARRAAAGEPQPDRHRPAGERPRRGRADRRVERLAALRAAAAAGRGRGR